MRKALVVGINDYPVCPLRGCKNDANAIASIIEKNGDGSPNFHVKKCLDVKTKGELRGLITELFNGANEAALLYFSGHGFDDSVGGYLVTPDYQTHDYGVSMDEILTLANNSKSKNRIVILDCCYSGGFGSPHCTGVSHSQICEGVTVLTASKSDETSVEVNGHGVFTNLLLAALDGGAADIGGSITSGSIYSFIDQALGPWEQRPVFKTNISSFFSIRTIKPTIPHETLRKLIEYFSTPSYTFKLDPSYEYTNTPEDKHDLLEPYADGKHVEIFKNLQKFVSVGLVEPIEEEHMYFAAMNSKACRLTPLGHHYWDLVNKNKF